MLPGLGGLAALPGALHVLGTEFGRLHILIRHVEAHAHSLRLRRTVPGAWLRGALTQAANGAARTHTFLGEHYHRIARRRGKAKAQVAVARSILVIIWHLLADPAIRFTDLGHGYYQARLDTDRRLKNHIRQIQALGFEVAITKAA